MLWGIHAAYRILSVWNCRGDGRFCGFQMIRRVNTGGIGKQPTEAIRKGRFLGLSNQISQADFESGGNPRKGIKGDCLFHAFNLSDIFWIQVS